MQGLLIKAQCTIFHNTLQINCKKKSKLSSISLQPQNKLLVVTGKGDNQVFKFPIQKLKTIYKKFIEEGKITIEFDSQVKGTLQKGLEIMSQNIQNNGNYQIFISNGCKENLQTLVNQLVLLKKETQQSNQKPTSHKQQQKEANAIKPKSRKSMPQPMKDQFDEKVPPKQGRKYLFSLSRNENEGKQSIKTNVLSEIATKNKVSITLLSLPQILLRQIFEFSGIILSHRLISKEVERLILQNIKNIKLKQQIEEQTFNKLAKWAINIEARPKHVKTLKLQDRHDGQQLLKSKAKTLKFGNWKQLSSKHIAQLKGLRIYCLEIPYSIKFQFSHLFGIRLVQLRLKGKGISVKNSMVKDQDLLHMINNVNDLKAIQVAYASTKLLCEIKKPQKMQQIRIGVLNKIGGYEDWINFKKFSNLAILAIEDTQKMGNTQDQQYCVYDTSFPDKLKWLQLGFNISRLSKSYIPTQLKYLKLLGIHFKNNDIDDFFLPALENLDIINCPNLTPQCLHNLANLKVLTNWDRNRVDYASNYYRLANITISSVRGFSYC